MMVVDLYGTIENVFARVKVVANTLLITLEIHYFYRPRKAKTNLARSRTSFLVPTD